MKSFILFFIHFSFKVCNCSHWDHFKKKKKICSHYDSNLGPSHPYALCLFKTVSVLPLELHMIGKSLILNEQ